MSERRDSKDPRSRPPDPAGTRPKFDPDALRPSRPSGAFRALPEGEPASRSGEGGFADTSEDGSAQHPERHPTARGENGRLPEPLAASAPPAAIPSQRTASPHAPRFQFMLGAMGTLAAAGVALAVSVALRPAPAPGVPWASWQPSGDADPAAQIAAHVAPEYRLSANHQLVSITGGPQAIGGQPVVVAIRTSGSSPAALPENGVFYQLCGEGPSCSIPGKPTVERGLLVKREALELALYTFHYLSGASQVIVTIPPAITSVKPAKGKSGEAAGTSPASSTTTPNHVLLFRPGDLASELSRPLDETLSSTAPTPTTMYRAPEASLVDSVTANLVYDSTLIPQQQQSSAVLLLQSPSIGG